MQSLRVRFAPSPTGLLHLGGLRTALFNFLLAKSTGGAFILRIEDTDQARVQPTATEMLIRSLDWAKLPYDEGPGKSSAYGPFIQSQRLNSYRKHVDQLLQTGHAYRCYCPEPRLDIIRQLALKQGIPAMYDRHCRHLSHKEHSEKSSQPSVVRFKTPSDGTTITHDLNFLSSTHNNALMDDFVLLKSDGFPTYHLASVVDDHLMHITHVMRGDEWLPSTPKHYLLYHAFGWQPPKFVHLPLLIGRDNKKLSKRDGITGKNSFVQRFQEEHYYSEALNNFVALLGWSPPIAKANQEIFSLQQLIDDFDINRLHSSPAIVDYAKLEWMQKQHFHRYITQDMPRVVEELRVCVNQEMLTRGITINDLPEHLCSNSYLSTVIKVIQSRVLRPQDITRLCLYFWFDPSYNSPDVQQLRAKLSKNILACLRRSLQIFTDTQPKSSDQYDICIEEVLKTDFQQCDNPLPVLSKSQCMTVLRLAVTGTSIGASISDTMVVIGLPTVLHRIKMLLKAEKMNVQES